MLMRLSRAPDLFLPPPSVRDLTGRLLRFRASLAMVVRTRWLLLLLLLYLARL